jgi:hypothetical protein
MYRTKFCKAVYNGDRIENSICEDLGFSEVFIISFNGQANLTTHWLRSTSVFYEADLFLLEPAAKKRERESGWLKLQTKT